MLLYWPAYITYTKLQLNNPLLIGFNYFTYLCFFLFFAFLG
uniref:Uncharacterized protein n=1 Tax=Anguilla anguilla TaxID=7936 RepID=A0A0E9VAG0_ANGAN